MILWLTSLSADPEGFWESMEYLGEIIVILGVIGEVLGEYEYLFPKDLVRRKRFEKLSALVLIVGLIFSLTALVRTNGMFGETIARLQGETAAANLKSSQLLKDVEDERLARVTLARSMMWRELSDDQKSAICIALTPKGATAALVIFPEEDQESFEYAKGFTDAINLCVKNLRNWTLQPMAIGKFSGTKPGLWIKFDAQTPSTKVSAEALHSALESRGVSVTPVSPGGYREKVTIIVGPRVPPQAGPDSRNPSNTRLTTSTKP
jgi:hypothetical protein